MRNAALFTAALVVVLSACQTKTPEVAKPAETQEAPTSAQVNERIKRCRAVEAVICGMPAVNNDLMYQATVKSGAAYNQIVYWSRFLTSKNQTLTPNPSTIYFHPFYNTRTAAPMVLEIPPAVGGSITGSVDTAWQTAVEDVGPYGRSVEKSLQYVRCFGESAGPLIWRLPGNRSRCGQT